MDILGLIGQQYMFLLLVVLFLGFGLGTWAILKSLFSKEGTKGPVKTAVSSNLNKANNIATDKSFKIDKVFGGINMNNGWLKLGVFSLIGLVISFSILGFISSNNSYNMNMSNGMNMNGTMNTQGTMNMSNGMNMNSTSTMNMSGQTMNSSYDVNMQNQLNQMQTQLNQMQMQLQNMMNSNNGQMQMPASNSNSNSNSSGSGSMSMPMM